MKITIFTTETCPRCERVKKALKALGTDFETRDMSSPATLTDLRVNGVFTLSAPVLQVDDDFYTVDDLFDGDRLRKLELDETGQVRRRGESKCSSQVNKS